MGAHEDVRTFEAANETEALKVARQIMEDARHEGGHDSYSGHIGVCHGVRVLSLPKAISAKKADEMLFGRWERCKKSDRDAQPRSIWKDGASKRAGFHRHVPGRAEKHDVAWLVRIQNKGSRKRLWLLGGMCAS